MTEQTGKTIRWLLALIFLVFIVIYGVWQVEKAIHKTTTAATRGLDQILSAITGSKTTMVEGRAVIEEKQQISELALMEMRMSAVRKLENSGALMKYFPLGTKQIVVRGHYKVKAGYRMQSGVALQMQNDEVVAHFPAAEILSVELIDFEEVESKDGWANKITGDDRAWVLRELKQQMEEESASSGMLDAVESTLRTRLKDLVGSQKVRVER
jgi:Protein of unknown function (DUF4230)